MSDPASCQARAAPAGSGQPLGQAVLAYNSTIRYDPPGPGELPARYVMGRISAFHAAVWDTVHREESPSKSAWQVTCKRCPWKASITSVTRVAQHISGSSTDVKKCPAPDPEMVQLVRHHNAASASAASSNHKRRGEDDMEPSPTRQRASRNASQEVVTKEMIDNTLTDLMTREWGVPLHILRGDGLAKFFRLLGLYPGTYTPPSCEHMQTVLVPKALQRLDSELAPMRAERASYGCSISFNGYTDESGRTMLNATVTTPSGSMLESAMDTDNKKMTSVYLKEKLKSVILHVGVEDVVAVFSDNAANCVAAGKMLEEDEELRVFSIPCGSDTLDLLLEDIGKLLWSAWTITLTKGLVHFVRAQPAVTGLFRTIATEMAASNQLPSHAQPPDGARSPQPGGALADREQLPSGRGQLPNGEASRQQAGAHRGPAARSAALAEVVPQAAAPGVTVTAYKPLHRLYPGETRYRSVLAMCQWVLDTHLALQAMVSDPRWAEWQAAADRATREAAAKTKDLVLGQAGKHSATWLLHVRQLVSIMKPICVVLRMMDSSQPTISKVWFAVKRMEQDIKAAVVEHNIPDADQILEAVQRRTNMLLRPLHGAAALLDPEYRQHFTMRGESSAGRLDFQAVLPDFKKVAEKLSPSSAAECVMQLPSYLHGTDALAAVTAKSMPPHQWHEMHTGGALGALAMKVTSQVASATSCNSAWSSYGFVHSSHRNRLTASNAEMLTQLYFNSRLLKRAGKGAASKAQEWPRLLAVNEDALEVAVEADLAKETARVAALEAEAVALALSP
ncbi:uncharacterized protein HaLaN_26127 [Haematococcus lacustris]|uniref:DUF659 domain-containing protein n=1 Tax=Haematococcus lacustris TaxID=44745 RepID=A0A6A0A5H3_HAELA|nr:uncharacterized protein HaLaN_26127 [Haematococcus lacustris]